jgi:glycosyltransferase involved in cell wall biosynthesis
MKLLIVTQAVDRDHSNLGFFVRWLEEFAKHCEEVIVIANEVGRYTLPKNVTVYGLGKEYGSARIKRYVKFLALIMWFTRSYDGVFCHMNPEFVLAGASWWRLLRKPTALWYVHGTVSTRLHAALALVALAYTTNKESLRIMSPKVRIVGHGIDTKFFAPNPSAVRSSALLSVGRLTESKHHDLVIHAAVRAKRPVRIAGDGPERANLEALAKRLGGAVTFLGGVSQEALREEYQRAGFLVHASTTGSMDKVVLEALACDCPVVTTSETYAHEKLWPVDAVQATEEAIADAVSRPQGARERTRIVREHHSLEKLIPKLVTGLSEKILPQS